MKDNMLLCLINIKQFGYSCSSLGLTSPLAQTVKNPPAPRETWVPSLAWGNSLEEGMVTHFRILAWRIPKDRGAWWVTDHGVTESQT